MAFSQLPGDWNLKTNVICLRIVDVHFCESISKSPRGRKLNKNQGPKTHQEDRRARKIQRNKCKGKQSTAKHRFAANYKSAAEYKSTAEYNSSAEWLRQIKTNWA